MIMERLMRRLAVIKRTPKYDDKDKGKHAVTHFRVIERFGIYTC